MPLASMKSCMASSTSLSLGILIHKVKVTMDLSYGPSVGVQMKARYSKQCLTDDKISIMLAIFIEKP